MRAGVRRDTTLSIAFFLMWAASMLRILRSRADVELVDVAPTAIAVLVGAWVIAARIARKTE